MLDEILEKNSSGKDKPADTQQELPNRLPSSHNRYVTHRTTFGRVRVDLPAKSEQRQMVESLYKSYDPTNEQHQKFETRLWSLVDEDVNLDKDDIDFYGLVNAHHRNVHFEEALASPKKEQSEPEENYIDQIAFPELAGKRPQVKRESLQKETIEQLKNEEMNPIDEQYFGTLKQIQVQETPSASATTTSRVEMPPAEDLNYIDQLVFAAPDKPTPPVVQQTKPANVTAPKASPAKLLDINFQFRQPAPARKSPPKPAPAVDEPPMDSYNPKLETMRSIKSKDYFDPPRQSSLDVKKAPEIDTAPTASEPAERIREQLTKKTSGRDSLGYRTFEDIVPHWWKMTKAEIVDVLLKQICFIRRECHLGNGTEPNESV